jgi:hypothetical protein
MLSEVSHECVALMCGPIVADSNIQERTEIRDACHISHTLFVDTKEVNREPIVIFHVEAAEFVLNGGHGRHFL